MYSSTLAWISSSGRTSSYSCASGWTASTSWCCKSRAGWICFNAHSKASAMVSSLTSLAPASTIITLPSLPATNKSSLFCSSSSRLIKAWKSPDSVKPILSPAIGPSNGTPDIIRAAEAANIATASGRNAGSIDRTVVTTWHSLR